MSLLADRLKHKTYEIGLRDHGFREHPFGKQPNRGWVIFIVKVLAVSLPSIYLFSII